MFFFLGLACRQPRQSELGPHRTFRMLSVRNGLVPFHGYFASSLLAAPGKACVCISFPLETSAPGRRSDGALFFPLDIGALFCIDSFIDKWCQEEERGAQGLLPSNVVTRYRGLSIRTRDLLVGGTVAFPSSSVAWWVACSQLRVNFSLSCHPHWGDPAQLFDVRCFPPSILSSSRVDLPTFPWTSPPFTCFHMAFMHAFSRLFTCVSPPLGILAVVHRRGGVEVHPSHVTPERTSFPPLFLLSPWKFTKVK